MAISNNIVDKYYNKINKTNSFYQEQNLKLSTQINNNIIYYVDKNTGKLKIKENK